MKTIAEIEYERWAEEEKVLINDPVIKRAFIEGYEKGRSDRIRYTFEELMQK